MGPHLDISHNALYFWVVVRGEVTSHDAPSPLLHCQLEANKLGTELLDSLHREMRCWLVEHCHSAVVPAQRFRINDAVPIQPTGVDSISYLGFFKDAQVHVGLVSPPQSLIQFPVSFILNIIGTEPNRHPPPCRNPATPIHPPSTDFFSSLDPTALPTCTWLPFS